MMPDIFGRIVNATYARDPALLFGFERRKVKDDVYPALVPGTNDHRVEGQIIRDLNAVDLARLDLFEGVMYERNPVTVYTGMGFETKAAAETYICRPQFMFMISEECWTLVQFTKMGKKEFLSDFSGWKTR